MRITKSALDKLPIPVSTTPGRTAQKRYYDDSMKGFGVRITSGGTKAFFVEKPIKNKLSRITLGRYPDLTVEMARLVVRMGQCSPKTKNIYINRTKNKNITH